MKKQVSVIDYGLCNIFNVCEAFKYVGANVVIIDKPKDIERSDYLVLPGVGAFTDGMNGLNEKKLITPILDYIKKSKPFLGICLGMQMMLSSSSEFGLTSGLDIIPGRIDKIPSDNNKVKYKIPHIGWNNLIMSNEVKNDLFIDVRVNYPVYFVHSFMAYCSNSNHCLAYTDYNGVKIPAIVKKYNAMGCQFHPEKSGHIGLDLLKKFIQI